jgi:excisionase family DNA binding protein
MKVAPLVDIYVVRCYNIFIGSLEPLKTLVKGLGGVFMEEIAIGIKDAAKAVGLSHWTLRQYIRQGKIAAVRIGRRVLVEPGELQRLVERGRAATDSRKE